MGLNFTKSVPKARQYIFALTHQQEMTEKKHGRSLAGTFVSVPVVEGDIYRVGRFI